MKLILRGALLGCAACAAACSGFDSSASAVVAEGNATRGHAAIEHYGCGTCHTIAGVNGAEALVGPSLEHMGNRSYVAGVLVNRPDNLVKWILDPPAIDPRTVMPKLDVTEQDARDIASYLYTLR